MESIYVITVAVFIIAIYFFLKTFKKRKTIATEDNHDPYTGLRDLALNLKAEDLELAKSVKSETALAAILEFGTHEGSATIFSSVTGDASMYFSSGGAIIGGFAHKTVSEAAIAFVESAQDYFPQMEKGNTDLPKPGHIKFHILTNKSTYSLEGAESEIAAETSQWAPFFYKGNGVITELRKISEQLT